MWLRDVACVVAGAFAFTYLYLNAARVGAVIAYVALAARTALTWGPFVLFVELGGSSAVSHEFFGNVLLWTLVVAALVLCAVHMLHATDGPWANEDVLVAMTIVSFTMLVVPVVLLTKTRSFEAYKPLSGVYLLITTACTIAFGVGHQAVSYRKAREE